MSDLFKSLIKGVLEAPVLSNSMMDLRPHQRSTWRWKLDRRTDSFLHVIYIFLCLWVQAIHMATLFEEITFSSYLDLRVDFSASDWQYVITFIFLIHFTALCYKVSWTMKSLWTKRQKTDEHYSALIAC